MWVWGKTPDITLQRLSSKRCLGNVFWGRSRDYKTKACLETLKGLSSKDETPKSGLQFLLWRLRYPELSCTQALQ